MGVTMATSVFPVAPTGAGAGPRPGAAASWQSLDPCTWSSYTSASSPATRSSLKRQVFSLLPPQAALRLLPTESRGVGTQPCRPQERLPDQHGGVWGTQSPLSYCGRPDRTQSQVAGKASTGSRRDPTEGREETKLQGEGSRRHVSASGNHRTWVCRKRSGGNLGTSSHWQEWATGC